MIKRIIILVYLTTLNYRFSTPISFTSRSRPQLLRSRRDTERQAPSAEDTAKDDRSAAQADMELYYRVYLILSLMDQAKQDYKDECKDAMIFYSFCFPLHLLYHSPFYYFEVYFPFCNKINV